MAGVLRIARWFGGYSSVNNIVDTACILKRVRLYRFSLFLPASPTVLKFWASSRSVPFLQTEKCISSKYGWSKRYLFHPCLLGTRFLNASTVMWDVVHLVVVVPTWLTLLLQQSKDHQSPATISREAMEKGCLMRHMPPWRRTRWRHSLLASANTVVWAVELEPGPTFWTTWKKYDYTRIYQ